MAKRRPEADDLLRMAEHRRRMQALGRVAETAGRVAASGELRHLRSVPTPPDDDPVTVVAEDGHDDGVIVSLAAARARRAGHPAGADRR